MWLRYIRSIALSFLAFMASVGAINWLIDPFGMFDSPIIANLNSKKTEAVRHGRLNKFATLERQHPRTLIIGSSRAEYGLDPEHPGFSERPVYNFAILGPRINEFLRMFQHVIQINRPQSVLFAVDFFVFNTNMPTEPDFSDARFAADPVGDVRLSYPIDRLKERTAVLLSMDTLVASWTTIFSQTNGSRFMLNNGLQDRSYVDDEIRTMGGYQKSFRSTERAYLHDVIFPAPSHEFALSDPRTHRSTLDNFAEILRLCHDNHIQLTLMISPIHARLLETIRVAGLWDTYEEWKRQLVMLNDLAATTKHNAAFPFWDFADYHAINREAVPNKTDNSTTTAWWWESSHYKKQLGDIVLDRIFDIPAPMGIDSEHFGTLITSNNIDEHLQQIRARQQHYESTHPTDVSEIETLRAFIADLKKTSP